ncbi:MAG: DUF63 family protein [Halobacteriaceae archaeon]
MSAPLAVGGVLPAGARLPPLPHLVALLAALGAVSWRLSRRQPRVDARTVVALAPWMGAGAAAHALGQLDLVPGPLAPLTGSPAVYGATFAVAGAVWLATDRVRHRRPERALAAAGLVAFAGAAGIAGAYGLRRNTLAVGWPLVALALAGVLGVAAWAAIRRLRPRIPERAGAAGALVVLGHLVDATTTAVGVGLLGFGERTPLSAFLLQTGAALPGSDALGGGLLFVTVKLAVAVVVVDLLVGGEEPVPPSGFLFLGVAAAVGLGPGLYNLVLFSVVGAPAG